MGINSYGLFNNGQSGSPYSDRNYELKRQLETRQQQLNDLDKMPSLTARQQEKREQLLHAVDHLSGQLNPTAPAKQADNTDSSATKLNSIGRRDTEDGIVIPKSKMDVANAYSKMTPNPRQRTGYEIGRAHV